MGNSFNMGNKIKEVLKELNMKPYHLAKTFGVTATLINNWLDGVSSPSAKNLSKFDKLGVNVRYLLGASDKILLEEKTNQSQVIDNINKVIGELYDNLKDIKENTNNYKYTKPDKEKLKKKIEEENLNTIKMSIDIFNYSKGDNFDWNKYLLDLTGLAFVLKESFKEKKK